MYNQLPAQETIDTTLKNLTVNGFNPIFSPTIEDAKQKVLELLPKGAEVMTMTSETLRVGGIADAINQSNDYISVRNQTMKLDRTTQGREMQKFVSTPDVAIGSVHAVTTDGHVLIASRTGSQLPAYVFGAGQVIWVVGAQKIVTDIGEGKKRIFDYILPLEGERANNAYHITDGSRVNKLVTYFAEEVPNRIHLILVNEILGF